MAHDELSRIFGENLTDRLDTGEKQQAALGIYQMVEEKEGADAAREGMMTPEPSLNGAAPIGLLAWGCINEVAIAAHARPKVKR